MTANDDDASSPAPGASGYRSREALRAAQMYYLQDLTMNAIARELEIGRAHV